MRPRMLTALAVTALALSAPAPAVAQADVFNPGNLWLERALAYADNCPFPSAPVDTACQAYTVVYIREGLPQGDPAQRPPVDSGRAKQPFLASAVIEDVVIHPDATFDVSVRAYGYTSDTSGTFDKARLTKASVLASIPMSDGSAFVVDLRWAADGTVQKFGNSGPFSGDVPTHFRDRCTTAHALDHQNFVDANASGTIGGIDIKSFEEVATGDGFSVGFTYGFIDNLWSHVKTVTHGNCTG